MHAFVNDLERPIGTYLYGRRMYETMVYWQTVDTTGDHRAVSRDFAELWQAADKVVYSRTLETASSPRTRTRAHLRSCRGQRAQALLDPRHLGGWRAARR